MNALTRIPHRGVVAVAKERPFDGRLHVMPVEPDPTVILLTTARLPALTPGTWPNSPSVACCPARPPTPNSQRQYSNVHSATDLDPVKDGIAMIEIQRRLSPQNPNVMNYRAGKFVQLTTVTPNEITTRIIHRWDD